MDFSGKIIAVLPQRSGTSKSGNEWVVAPYVIEDHGQYPRKMYFEVFGADKIREFNIQAGEEMTVSFDIDARQWNDRWFNTIRAWKVQRQAAVGPQGMPARPEAQPQSLPQGGAIPQASSDDLPF